MARHHDQVRQLLAGEDLDETSFHWHQVLALLHAVTRERTVMSERLLRELVLFKGKLRLDESQGLPHSMTPEDFLRSVAVQTLARWDRSRHQDVIGHLVEHAPSERLENLARALLDS